MAKSGSFNITDKVIDYAYRNVADMPGNPGQEVLVEMLKKQMANGECITSVTIDDDNGFNADAIMDLDFSSPHPEAIEIIINRAIEHAELLTHQSTIPGPWAFADAEKTGNWKIVGYDI